MNLVIERRFGFGRQTDMLVLVLALSWFTFGSLFQTVRAPARNFYRLGAGDDGPAYSRAGNDGLL